MGEVFDGRVEVLAQYLGNAADSLVDYPTFYTLRDVFQQKQSMSLIPYRRGQQRDFFQDVRVFGTFVENHDNPRFLHDQKDKTLYRYEVCKENMSIIFNFFCIIPCTYPSSFHSYPSQLEPCMPWISTWLWREIILS